MLRPTRTSRLKNVGYSDFRTNSCRNKGLVVIHVYVSPISNNVHSVIAVEESLLQGPLGEICGVGTKDVHSTTVRL